MTAVIVTAIIAGTFAWLWTRLEPLISRLLDVTERRTVVLERVPDAPPPPKAPQSPPMDMIMEAMAEGTEWAREDAIKHLWELYAEENDWERVRVRWGVTKTHG